MIAHLAVADPLHRARAALDLLKAKELPDLSELQLSERLLTTHAAEGLHVLGLAIPTVNVVLMRYRHAVYLERAVLPHWLHAHGAHVVGPQMRVPLPHHQRERRVIRLR